jgi:hypothetical protein
MGASRGIYRILLGKPLGRPRLTWEHNIKMNLGQVEWVMDWVYLV